MENEGGGGEGSAAAKRGAGGARDPEAGSRAPQWRTGAAPT